MSGLEMSQNSARLHRTEDDLREALKKIMKDIHDACVDSGTISGDKVDYVRGANIAGFKKVADAMLARVADQGVTIAIANSGGLRAGIDAGEVTMGEVLTVLPFQNTLSTFEITGQVVIDALPVFRLRLRIPT